MTARLVATVTAGECISRPGRRGLSVGAGVGTRPVEHSECRRGPLYVGRRRDDADVRRNKPSDGEQVLEWWRPRGRGSCSADAQPASAESPTPDEAPHGSSGVRRAHPFVVRIGVALARLLLFDRATVNDEGEGDEEVLEGGAERAIGASASNAERVPPARRDRPAAGVVRNGNGIACHGPATDRSTAIHRIAITQMRCHPCALEFLERRRAMGNTSTEALRALERRLSDIVSASSSTTPDPTQRLASGKPLDIGANHGRDRPARGRARCVHIGQVRRASRTNRLAPFDQRHRCRCSSTASADAPS